MTLRTIGLREAGPADEPFLRQVFRNARHTSGGVIDPILTLPYRVHADERQARHPRARTSIIIDGGEAVGTITVDRDGSRVHLVDIAVLSERRGRGIASAVLAQLVSAGDLVTLSVWALNSAALRLYERHGFAVVAEQFGYLLMATEADG